MNKFVARNLQRFREEKNLSREDLADILEIDAEDITDWESGKASPDLEKIVTMCDLFDITPRTLLQEDPDEYEQALAEQEYAEEAEKKKEGPVMRAFRVFPYPLVVVALYLLLGYLFNIYHPLWLIFLTVPIYYSIINVVKTKRAETLDYPVIVTGIFLTLTYFLYDFNFNENPLWLVFLTIPVYYYICSLVSPGK